MKKIKLIKITLLIIVLAEEIRSVKGKPKYDYDSINGIQLRKGLSTTDPSQKYVRNTDAEKLINIASNFQRTF